MYESVVHDGGIVALPNIVPTSAEGLRPRAHLDVHGGEVPKFWGELREHHEGRRVSSRTRPQAGLGIGAVRVP